MAADVGQFAYTTGNYTGSTLTSASKTTVNGNSFLWVGIGLLAALTFTPSDSKGNTYNLQGSISSNTSDGISLGVYLCTNGVGGAGHTWSYNASANSGCWWWGIELTGAPTSSIVDAMVGAVTGFLNNPTTQTITTSNDNDLILVWWQNNTTVLSSVSSSTFTTVNQDLTNGNIFAKLLSGAHGTFNPAISFSPSGGRAQMAIIAINTASSVFTLTAANGSYTITGEAASLVSGYSLQAAAGSYAISGQSAALDIATNLFTLIASPGSYDIVGADSFSVFQLDAANGLYSVAGQNAVLTGPGGVRKYGVSSSGVSKSSQAATNKFNVSGPGVTRDPGTEESLP